MMELALLDDFVAIYGEMDDETVGRVVNLIPYVSDIIRYEGMKVGKNVDEMVKNCAYASVVKSVVVAVVKRYLNETDESTQMSQMTQSALGYSLTGTYVSGGGGIKLLNNELKQLGFRRAWFGAIDYAG